MKILVIIPAYNEEKNIKKVVSDLQENYKQYDYLVVNDCSNDNTEKILFEQKTEYVNLPVNLGIGGAVQTGYRYALANNYDIAVQMDGDGQHNSQYIEDIIMPIIDGEADAVIGSRFIEKKGFQSSFLRRLGINFLGNLIFLLCGTRIMDATSGFRAVNRKGIELFAKEYAQDYPEPEAILALSIRKLKIKEVPVIMNEREGGTSSINGMKSIYYMVKVSVALLVTKFITKGKK